MLRLWSKIGPLCWALCPNIVLVLRPLVGSLCLRLLLLLGLFPNCPRIWPWLRHGLCLGLRHGLRLHRRLLLLLLLWVWRPSCGGIVRWKLKVVSPQVGSNVLVVDDGSALVWTTSALAIGCGEVGASPEVASFLGRSPDHHDSVTSPCRRALRAERSIIALLDCFWNIPFIWMVGSKVAFFPLLQYLRCLLIGGIEDGLVVLVVSGSGVPTGGNSPSRILSSISAGGSSPSGIGPRLAAVSAGCSSPPATRRPGIIGPAL